MTRDGAERHEGTVVLVHGGWSHPDDWRWVRAPLDAAGLTTVAVDLPSHRDTESGLTEDARFVVDALDGASRPLIGLGWSYGGSVLAQAVGLGLQLDHLVLLGSVPQQATSSDEPDLSWVEVDPHIELLPDGRFVLDGTWWLEEEAGRDLPEHVRTAIRSTPRRPSTRGTLAGVDGDRWTSVPTTVMYGVDDPFITPEQREWAAQRFDVRPVAGDHFVLFRTPEVVSGLVLDLVRD